MKTQFKPWAIGLVIAGVAFFSSCDDDENDADQQASEKSYTLSAVSDPAISGKVTFTKQDEATTRIVIELDGTAAGGDHPAHIHANSAAENGPIVLDLTNVDGATGESVTMAMELNDGTPVTYEQLIAFDGHVNVHLSPTQLATRIAQGDIGSNSDGSASGNGNGDGYGD